MCQVRQEWRVRKKEDPDTLGLTEDRNASSSFPLFGNVNVVTFQDYLRIVIRLRSKSYHRDRITIKQAEDNHVICHLNSSAIYSVIHYCQKVQIQRVNWDGFPGEIERYKQQQHTGEKGKREDVKYGKASAGIWFQVLLS